MAKKVKDSYKALMEKNPEELIALVNDNREALRSYRFTVAGAKPKSLQEMREHKKTVARALTEIRRRKTS